MRQLTAIKIKNLSKKTLFRIRAIPKWEFTYKLHIRAIWNFGTSTTN